MPDRAVAVVQMQRMPPSDFDWDDDDNESGNGAVRVVTAYDAPDRMKRQYRRRKD